MQFYREGEWINYDLIPRKHADPIRRLILRHQTDIAGTSWEEYPDLLFVGDKDDMGLLAKAAPWVIYKRNDVADWAQFAEVFGMPIQEYTYETDDDEARQRAIEDATGIGSLGVFIHGKDTELNLREAGNKSGSADLYDKLCERCNSEISKLILGNTLTTEASRTGTQALGTVHKKVEDKLVKADCRYVLDVLNYDMTDIFLSMGVDTTGGTFCFPEQKETDLNTEINVLSRLKKDFGLPISDDYLYEKFGVEKPKDYKLLKAETNQKIQTPVVPTPVEPKEPKTEKKPGKETEEPTARQKRDFMAWLKSFFVHAPEQDGAALKW
jgi:phage gp29-like protein